MTRERLLNYACFAALMLSTALGFQSLWGLLFLYWTIKSFHSGHALLLEPIAREDDPILFWLIQSAWIVLGLLMIVQDIFPGLL